MDISCTWKEKLLFSASMGEHTVLMDAKAPIGTHQGATPKELVLAAICGCSGMDVISLLRKAKQLPTSMTIEARAELVDGHPAMFKQVHVRYRAQGTIQADVLVDAVKKSMTLYCGVSAMIAKACPISYEIEHNELQIGVGEARF